MIKPRDFILNISPYIGGDYDPPGFIRESALASNENPFGASPLVKEAIEKSINNCHLYPNGPANALKKKLSDIHGVDPEWILCGNGSEELLHLIARVYGHPGSEFLFAENAFALYKIAAFANGAYPIEAKRTKDYTLFSKSFLEKISERTSLIFIDHPGNPIGSYLQTEDLRILIEKTPPHVLIIIDSAYAEFCAHKDDYHCGVQWVQDHPNVVMTRTFSKAYGLGGVRIGWLYGNPSLISVLNRVRPPFNTSSLAQEAAKAALEDQEWVIKTINHTHETQKRTLESIQKMGYSYIPCHTNFLLINFGKGCERIYQFLGQNGVIVRPMKAYGLNDYLRISIGLDHEMIKFVKLIEQWQSAKEN